MSTTEYYLSTTPWYINKIQSPFWSCLAKEVAFEEAERCPHSKDYMNFRVYCVHKGIDEISLRVICRRCGLLYFKTGKAIENKYLEYYGF